MDVLDSLSSSAVKSLPHHREAEAAVLSALLIDSDAIPRAIEVLRPNYFFQPAHEKIFETVIRLFEQSKVVDLVTLVNDLEIQGALSQVGGAAYLAELTNVVPTSANLEHHIRILHEKFVLRALIQAGTQIARDGYESSQEADGLLDQAERMIFEIANQRFSNRTFVLKDVVRDCIEIIDRLYQRKENITGVPTGFHEFDIQTAGLQPSDFVIVAARPSMGKSAFVTNICEHVGVTERIPVAIFSLEMSVNQLTQRMLCSQARVDAHKVRTGFLAQSDWPRLTDAANKLSKAPIYIDDTPGISILELRAKARRMKARYDVKLVVVDYLQLMRADGHNENRQQEISMISRSLKALARELNVPVIAVSQLSRAVESRSDHRPQLSDLRESGAIEQDADTVILLMREDYYKQTDENRGIAEVNIAKQRNGPVGALKLAFIREYTRFENLEAMRKTM